MNIIPLLKFDKRKIILTITLFIIVYFFLPSVNCMEDFPTSQKICHQYGECEVDYYFSLSRITFGYQDGEFYCPDTHFTVIGMISLMISILIFTYLVVCTLDWCYTKFRDK